MSPKITVLNAFDNFVEIGDEADKDRGDRVSSQENIEPSDHLHQPMTRCDRRVCSFKQPVQQ